ncbi:transcriptional regulator [Chitinophaga caeni]|uniref:Transcriptional regulator n=1 Tax=Chitinophaga caeni TaxID=2029983 RepID=A0A291QSQ3_9BACT|nr:ImmA/IrrE family metallo-endopeptidase [Chitinophaga caeni]ATL46998.1 transcriptional regulator [Chitinophaga caeni]
MLKERYLEFRANKFREEHGLTPTEPADVYKLLARLNVITVFKEITGNFSGMAVKNGTGNFMMVNSNDILARQHFTIGHELYHLIIQENFKNRICEVGTFDKKDSEEYNADWFASYLLMPEGGIFELLPREELSLNKISLNTIVKMEQYFGVSRAALLNRLMFIDLVSKAKKDELQTTGSIKRSALLMGYSSELYENGNAGKVIGDYGEKAKKLYDKELISETDFYGLMLDIGIDLDTKFEEDDKTER